ncbi:MAG: ATP-binding protein [Acidobacteria bacterium]|nr:ATP-binding protein [Acidobacteriota bacterium]
MLDRAAAALVRDRLSLSPAVAILGARQCGKTTLARSFGGAYFDLEQPAERLRADLQWDALIDVDRLVTFDEAQSWPELFERLRGAIDADRPRTGRFLLLGSVSPALTRHVSESLAGRLSLVELSPLLWNELDTDAMRRRLWLCGGYPDGGVLTPRAFPHWQRDYLTLITQRDLPAWGLPAKPQTTERLLRMLAALHGQIWNASQVGQSLGLSYHTVNTYLDFLVGAFLLRRLPPYGGNIRKRLVKSPRVYWRDTGLLHALLNTPDETTLLGQPWVGASWEGFVIEQALGALSARGTPFEAFHFRTSDGQELDLVLEVSGQVLAVEIKLTTAPSQADMDRLNRTADLIGATRRVLVTRTSRPSGDDVRLSANLPTFIDLITRLG